MYKILIRHLLPVLFILISINVHTQTVKPGIDVLTESNFDVLQGKRVGLVTNPTGVNRYLKSTIDILFEAPNVNLTALYGPEHGIRGDFAAGDKVSDYIDERTNLPVYSLYGKTRKPTPEMLQNIDVIVFDIQDIGCRSYTFISTMGLVMEAAAENDKEVVILDRPNPLSGNKIEGNIVEEGYFSFVSQFPVPYVHGLTVGELAKLLNGEGMLKDGNTCELTVVPMEGWKRDMSFDDTGLFWVPTSPHIPYKESCKFYVSTGVLGEMGVISEGVGYTIPFQLFTAPWIDAELIAKEMNDLGIEGVIFRPITIQPYYGRYEKQLLHGVQIHFTDYQTVNLMSLQFRFLEVHNKFYPEKNPFEMNPKRIAMFDKVAGTSKVREMFTKNFKYADIKDFLNKDIESFRTLSEKYYLYE